MSKTVSQKNFKKGLVGTTGDQSQPPGSVARISNLVYNKRGSLTTCDGSLIISAFSGIPQPGAGPWTEIALFQPTNANRYYVGIQKTYNVLGSVAGLAVADGGAGGTLAAANYRYIVTALDGAGGESAANAAVVFANPGAHKAAVTWTVFANATGYKVYRSPAGGAGGTEVFLTTVTTNSFTDDGSIAPGTAGPPSTSTIQNCPVYQITAPSYTAAQIIATLPADAIVPQDGTPGHIGSGGGGTGGTGAGSGSPPNASGGIIGNISPLPQMVQFNNRMIIAPGNSFPPQAITDGAPPTVAALTNTFTASYPNWVASATHQSGDVILPTAGNAGNFVFKCTQGGTSAAGAPTWSQTKNQIVGDNNIIWQNTGITNANIAPRGAAHACVYAGSLWLLNTQPTTTTDELDGPSCLKMSDINNHNSWNPLNTAFLDRDDSDYGTGLQPYTIAEAGIPPTGSLIAFKNFSTFQINGVFGSSGFSIQRAQTDMGCIASRSTQFLPGFGVARMTHLGVAIFDGTRDRLISEDIRPWLFGDSTLPDIQPMDWNFAYFSKGAQCADPPMYMLAVPIALGPAPEVSMTLVADGTSTWFIFGTAYFKVTAFTLVNGVAQETNISVQFPLSPQSGATSPRVQGTPNPLATKYRVYYGLANLAYSSYVDITPAQFQAGVVFHSQAAFTAPGTLNAGIGGLTRILCYDLVQKCWTVIDLPFSIAVLKQVRAPGTQPITIAGSFNDATTRRLQAGDTTWDGTPIAWSVRPAELLVGGGTSRVFYERVSVKGIATPANLATITVTPSYDYVDDISQVPVTYSFGQSRFLAWADLLITALTAHATVQGTGQVEIDALDWSVEPLPAEVPPQFA